MDLPSTWSARFLCRSNSFSVDIIASWNVCNKRSSFHLEHGNVCACQTRALQLSSRSGTFAALEKVSIMEDMKWTQQKWRLTSRSISRTASRSSSLAPPHTATAALSLCTCAKKESHLPLFCTSARSLIAPATCHLSCTKRQSRYPLSCTIALLPVGLRYQQPCASPK